MEISSKVSTQSEANPGQIIKIYGEVKSVGTRSIIIRLEARRHSVYNGSQRIVLTTDMTFVRIDGDGEAIPISDKVKDKYRKKPTRVTISDDEIKNIYEGD